MQPLTPDPNHLTKLSSNTSAASSRDPTLVPSEYAASETGMSETGEVEDAQSTQTKRSWFKKKKRSKSNAESLGKETVGSGGTDGGRERDEDDVMTPLERTAREDEWRLGDDIRQHLDI
jgi:hypothetical protein